jgi:demethylsterigmatocystin 6-O-methyltransferase
MAENPWALDLAIAHMRVQRAGRPVFFDVLDFKERFARDATSETVLFVDIGGSTGPQSLSLRSRFPDLPGRVIVQDRPEIVQQAKGKIDSSTNIEIVVHDFMTPQPVTGAKVYYLRNILHAWDDETCVKILQNIKVAMTEESTILLDENVVPERDAPARVAEHDIEMMLCLGTKERTKAMWQALVEKAGLKMHEVIIYDEDDQDGVIVVMLK